MARDDCFYDYLRDREYWTFNPYAYHISETTELYTVCEPDAEGAIPLYDKIGGQICLYVKEQTYGAEDRERLERELEAYEVKIVQHTETCTFHGFVAGTSYDKETTEESERLSAGKLVISDGRIIGGVADGTWDSGGNRSEEKRFQAQVFLPTGAEGREIRYVHNLTVYGSDDEEDEFTLQKFASVVKR